MRFDDRLSRHIHSFFHDFLVGQQNVSPHTLLSYRDTIKLFLQFASEHLKKPVVDLLIEELNVDLVLGFLEYLEKERRNLVGTRNVRLAALHAFFGHIATRDPLLFAQCHRIVGIPMKRTSTPAVEYLEHDELETLLSSIDRSKPKGRRDYALLTLCYQTGMRVQEIVNVRACDLQLTSSASVRIWGKGRKERILPLWPQTTELLRSLLSERNIPSESTAFVFVNRQGEQLTRWGVRYILNKYAGIAKNTHRTIAKKRVYPHLLRHTSAVHMLDAGADPNTLRDFLGHESSETTWRYARITMEKKRKAVEACASGDGGEKSPVPIWRQDDDLLAQLESIGRRPINVEKTQRKP